MNIKFSVAGIKASPACRKNSDSMDKQDVFEFVAEVVRDESNPYDDQARTVNVYEAWNSNGDAIINFPDMFLGHVPRRFCADCGSSVPSKDFESAVTCGRCGSEHLIYNSDLPEEFEVDGRILRGRNGIGWLCSFDINDHTNDDERGN